MNCVTNITWRTASGARLGGFAYEYDAVGRIVLRSHAIGSNAFDRVYAYDDLDRLASDSGVAYTYDAAGNRMTRTENGETITYTLGIGDRLASYGRAGTPRAPQSAEGAYTHDAAGNVTRIEREGRPTLGLTWNSQYQLVSVSTNGAFAESYEYDALGRRVSTTTLEGTTRHVYDDGWQVIADLDEDGNVVASYTWGEGIDSLLAVDVCGESYYSLTDIQGTVWGYVDSQNNVVARWRYDAWGNIVDEDVVAPALANIRYRFQCREWSAATGLVNFRMRWYDAETGRWLSKDPIGLSGGLNLYVLCDDDALNYVDSYGCGKAGIVIKIGNWGIKVVKNVSNDVARRLYLKGGKDIKGSKQMTKKMSKRKGYKKPKVEVHSDECGSGYEHYHPPGRKTIYGTKGGHGFILKKFTAVGLIGDCWYAEVLDIFNPVSDVVDIIELFEDEEE